MRVTRKYTNKNRDVKGDKIMKKIKLGFAPTRRSIFSAPDAVKYRGLTAKRLDFCMMTKMLIKSQKNSKKKVWMD